MFKKLLFKEIQPDPHPFHNIYKSIGLKLLTRLRLSLSHLNEHRLNRNFENCVNPLCNYSLEAETFNFFLHCHDYHSIRLLLFNEYCEMDMNSANLSGEKFLNIILYGSSLFSDSQHWSNLNSTIKYITDLSYFSRSIL